jgi:hypothetical protein
MNHATVVWPFCFQSYEANMKSKISTKKSAVVAHIAAMNECIAQSYKPLDFDPSRLRIPTSASPKKQSNIETAAHNLFRVLVRTGVKFKDAEMDGMFDVAKEADAVAVLVTERETSSWETEPQVAAAGRIITDVAAQAVNFRATFGCAATKIPTFEQALDAMDKVAAAVGSLGECHRFDMNVEMAATGMSQYFGTTYYSLFSDDGRCDRNALQTQAKRLTVVYSTNPFKTARLINKTDAKSIASAVKLADLFEFSIGKIDVKNSDFMDSLAQHLEKQRRVTAKEH